MSVKKLELHSPKAYNTLLIKLCSYSFFSSPRITNITKKMPSIDLFSYYNLKEYDNRVAVHYYSHHHERDELVF